MIKKGSFFGIYLVLVTLFACENHGVAKPDQLIPEAQMEKILLDIVIMKATKSNYRGKLSHDSIFGDQYIYKKYNITAEQLKESELYYSKIPKIYARMHRDVLSRLKRISDSLERVIRVEKEEKIKNNEVR